MKYIPYMVFTVVLSIVASLLILAHSLQSKVNIERQKCRELGGTYFQKEYVCLPIKEIKL